MKLVRNELIVSIHYDMISSFSIDYFPTDCDIRMSFSIDYGVMISYFSTDYDKLITSDCDISVSSVPSDSR